jgi:hypothetical protein
VTWDEAFKEIQKGKNVARPNWKAAWVYQAKHKYFGIKNVIVCNLAFGGYFNDKLAVSEMGEFPYGFPKEDTTANDWYVITDPKYYTNAD